ncbi:MAG: glycosyltransferase family 4 protein [Oscillospiraceae bacterium]|nr:glycosyltransferase family 4 protein [Oscillospiraceae bacterium]
MTVLQVCAYGADYPGNFISALEHLEYALKEKGVGTVYAFVGRAADRDWCRRIQNRTKVYFLPEAKARILPETYGIFRQIYRENDISVVHSHFELYDIPATVMAKPGTKIFWHLHDAIGEGYSKTGLLHRILCRIQYGAVGRRATLLTVSQKHGAFAQQLGFPGKQILFTPNGIDTNRIKPVDVDAASAKMVMLGWDILRKGVDVALEAARNVPEWARIVIVGYDDCAQYLREHRAPSCVEFQEPVKDINLLYADARAFVHVSRAEGLSYALLEALYAGLPVICSDIPENRFAGEFRNVEMIPVADPGALSDAICRILQDNRGPTKEDQAYNRSLIEARYSLHAWCRTVINHYGV